MIIPIFGMATAVAIVLAIGGFILALARLAIGPRTGGDDEASGAMVAALERMESRIATLERILDADHPRWRSRT